MLVDCKPPRLGEDWQLWEWQLAEEVIKALRKQSRYQKGGLPHTEVTVIGRGVSRADLGRKPREWSILAVERSQYALVTQK